MPRSKAMVRTRLDFLPGRRAEQIAAATDAERRAVCLRACKLAVQGTSLDDPLIEKALRSLEQGLYTDGLVVQGLKRLVEELDGLGLDAIGPARLDPGNV